MWTSLNQSLRFEYKKNVFFSSVFDGLITDVDLSHNTPYKYIHYNISYYIALQSYIYIEGPVEEPTTDERPITWSNTIIVQELPTVKCRYIM